MRQNSFGTFSSPNMKFVVQIFENSRYFGGVWSKMSRVGGVRGVGRFFRVRERVLRPTFDRYRVSDIISTTKIKKSYRFEYECTLSEQISFVC